MSALHLSIRRQALKIDALKKEMRLFNRPIQCIDVQSISILIDGKWLIVVFVSELALRKPLSQTLTRAQNVILCLFLRCTFLGIKVELRARTCWDTEHLRLMSMRRPTKFNVNDRVQVTTGDGTTVKGHIDSPLMLYADGENSNNDGTYWVCSDHGKYSMKNGW